MPHAPDEVAVGRGDRALARGEDAHVPSQARAAGRCGNHRARVDEHVEQPFVHRLLPDGVGGRDDDAAHALGDLFAAQDVRRDAKVGDMPVRARTDDDLVDLHVAPLGGGAGVLGQVGEGDGRLQFGEVDLDRALVFGVRIRLEHADLPLEAAVEVFARYVVDGEDAVLRARLDRHVADGEAVVDREVLDAVADEFHRFIQRAVHADEPDDVQDDVLAADVFCGFVFQNEFDGGGHLEPALPAHHARGHVRRADARRKGAERAVGAGVAVRADHQVARADQTLLGQKRVLDAHAAHVKKVVYAVFSREGAHRFHLFGRLDILVRGKVVHDHAHPLGAFDAGKARLFKFFNGDGRGDVVSEHHVQLGIDQLARLYACKPRVRREDLLRHCHSHSVCISL